MESEYITIGEKIKKLRLEKGVTQTVMTEWIGVSLAYMSQVECGIRNPGVGTINRVAGYFGITTEELFEDVYIVKFGLVWIPMNKQALD